MSDLAIPQCPLTGSPARRLVRTISFRSLQRYWRIVARFDLATLFPEHNNISLWEAADGLLFYDPLIPGDDRFYRSFYKYWGIKHDLTQPRAEFFEAARFVDAGERVLDVGCGYGTFGSILPQCDYVGIDASFCESDASHLTSRISKPLRIRQQSIEDHASENPTPYDVVSAFHVLEHVSDPIGLAKNMLRLLRPGGRLIVAVPKYPSSMHEIPAFPVNMPPHHLTFWTDQALLRLARQIGLTKAQVFKCPVQSSDQRVLSIHRMSLLRTGEDFARLDARGVASLIFASIFGTLTYLARPYHSKSLDYLSYLVVGQRPIV